MVIVGELTCLACGRYLADAMEENARGLRLVAPRGYDRPMIRLRRGRPFCAHCGGRAFIEYDLGHRGSLSTPAATAPAGQDEVPVAA